jgi:hypothetical protein
MNQLSELSAGKPGRFTIPENAPAKEIVRNTGMINDGKNADGMRGINIKLRFATAHVIADDDIYLLLMSYS